METQNQYPQKDYSEIISLSHQVFAGKESADVIEGSGFMYDHLYVEWRKPDYIGSRVQNLHAHLPF